MSPRRPATLSEVAGGAAFVLAAGLASLVCLWPASLPGAAAEAPPPVPADVAAAALMARPPFDPSRRPASALGTLPAPAASAPVVAEASIPRVSGVMLEGGRARALFEDGDWRGVGEFLPGGWSLASVAADEVRIARGGETRVLVPSDALGTN